MGLARGSLSDDQTLDLMLENPQLIRRPVIVRDGRIQLGYGAKQGLMI